MDGLRDLPQQPDRHHTQQLPDPALLQVLAARRDNLIEKGKRVAQAAFRGLGERAERPLVGLDFLCCRDRLQPRIDLRVIEQAKSKMLATGLDGRRQLVRIKSERGGGSSRVFSSALKASVVSMWTSSMIKTLYRSRAGR
jgi:hypothetical protein